MQIWLPFVSAPHALVPGSCEAERLAARVRFGSGGTKLTFSLEECAARQRAYQSKRAQWLQLIEAESRRASTKPLEGNTGLLWFE
jgi:hypothetical protein